MSGTNYVTVTVALREQIRELGVADPVTYVSRPGGGDPPRWNFEGGYVARGGHAAEAYLRGLLVGLEFARDKAAGF